MSKPHGTHLVLKYTKRFAGATGISSLSGKPDPVVLRIAMADVGEAFSRGLRDFQALLPRDIALASIYVIGGLVIL